MNYPRIAYGHRLIGEPVRVDEGFEAMCSCSFSEWGPTPHDAVTRLLLHFDAVTVSQ